MPSPAKAGAYSKAFRSFLDRGKGDDATNLKIVYSLLLFFAGYASTTSPMTYPVLTCGLDYCCASSEAPSVSLSSVQTSLVCHRSQERVALTKVPTNVSRLSTSDLSLEPNQCQVQNHQTTVDACINLRSASPLANAKCGTIIQQRSIPTSSPGKQCAPSSHRVVLTDY